jgi:hypothetical protein
MLAIRLLAMAACSRIQLLEAESELTETACLSCLLDSRNNPFRPIRFGQLFLPSVLPFLSMTRSAIFFL